MMLIQSVRRIEQWWLYLHNNMEISFMYTFDFSVFFLQEQQHGEPMVNIQPLTLLVAKGKPQHPLAETVATITHNSIWA